MTGESRGSWSSEAYVSTWTASDALGGVLDFPRRLSAVLVGDSGIEVRHVADLGAGTGTYLEVLLDAFPAASGLWVDASEPMLDRAGERLGHFGERVTYVLHDARRPPHLPAQGPFDVVVTSRVLHHFDPQTLRSIYRAIRERLRPGGFLFNLDHFASPGDWEVRYRRVRPVIVGSRRGRREHEHDAPRQPLARHLEWLEAAAFEPPDVAWKSFWTALVAARRPEA